MGRRLVSQKDKKKEEKDRRKKKRKIEIKEAKRVNQKVRCYKDGKKDGKRIKRRKGKERKKW